MLCHLWFCLLKTSVHFMLPGLLQLTVLRHHRRSDEPVVVCPECGCMFGLGNSTVRPHQTSDTGAVLASGSTSGGFLDGHPGLPVTVRHGSSLSGQWLLVGLRGRSSVCFATSRTCVARWTYYGDRCFAAACPKLWNSLPADLRQDDINFQRF